MLKDPNLDKKKIKENKKFVLWWLSHRITTRLRALPNFIIIGTAKGGTTSLFEYLSKHPRVFPPLRKQVKYFYYNYALGFDWYQAHFPLRRKLNSRQSITGEATPNYMFRAEAIQRIAMALPNIKLIALLRNPVERAYSHYNYIQQVSKETLSFDDAINKEINALDGNTKKTADETEHSQQIYPHRNYIARGRYIEQIPRLYKFFSDENILILKSEDFFTDTPTIFQKTLKFLDLPAWELNNYTIFKKGKYSEINPETRNKLEQYYHPYNQELYEFLNRDFGWES